MECKKIVLMSLFAGQEQSQTERADLWAQWGQERPGRIERGALKYMHDQVQNSELTGSCCVTQGAHAGSA